MRGRLTSEAVDERPGIRPRPHRIPAPFLSIFRLVSRSFQRAAAAKHRLLRTGRPRQAARLSRTSSLASAAKVRLRRRAMCAASNAGFGDLYV